MALNAAALSADMRSAMLADPEIGAVDGPALTAMCAALAGAVVSHITTSAQVTTLINPLGLTAPAAPGPVVGSATGSGTIT